MYPQPLNTDQFTEALKIFSEIYQQTLNRLPDITKFKISNWIKNTVNRSKPYSLFREDKLLIIIESMSDEDIYDFVFDISFKFFSFAQTNDKQKDSFTRRLCTNLASGLEVVNDTSLIKTKTTLPRTITDSLISSIYDKPTYLDALLKRDPEFTKFMLDNKHFIIILLIILTIE